MKEVEVNAAFIERVIDIENKDENILSGKRIIDDRFLLDAYKQGYASKYLGNDTSIRLVAEFYRRLSAGNSLLDSAAHLEVSSFYDEDKFRGTGNMYKDLINLCKQQKGNAQKILDIIKSDIQ